MTIVLRQNETLELNVVDYQGAVTVAQLKAIAAFAARKPGFLKNDVLNIVHPGAEFSAVDFRALDALFARYRQMFARFDFQIYRRSAWLCLSAAADAHVAYWVREPDLREAFSTNARRFDTLAEAGDWLLLSSAEIAALDRGEGLSEIGRFEDTPAAALAR